MQKEWETTQIIDIMLNSIQVFDVQFAGFGFLFFRFYEV